jgi:dihydroorotate dehydrogenase
LQAVLEESLGLPVLVKIAPDLADEDILAVADLALELGLAGVIATNTTISREGLKTSASKVEAIGAGGLSGAPLKTRSLAVLKLLAGHLNGRLAIISVGGIETAAEARERLAAGATLVQGYSGFIYEGPLWARRINRGI